MVEQHSKQEEENKTLHSIKGQHRSDKVKTGKCLQLIWLIPKCLCSSAALKHEL